MKRSRSVYGKLCLSLSTLAICAVPFSASAGGGWYGGDSIELTPIGTFDTGVFDDGAAEIVAYDPATERLFVVNGADSTIDVLDISDPSDPQALPSINVQQTPADDKANSVAVHDGLVAAGVENTNTQAPGAVLFFDTDGTFLKRVVVGDLPTGGPGEMVSALPDMVSVPPPAAMV